MSTFQSEREQLAQLEWLFEQKKFAEGLARTEDVLREFPASFHLKFLRYRFLRQLQQNVEALQLLREMHAMSGDNIMVVRELADLNFQQKQLPESLLYYKKLVFLDPFNSMAQERVKFLEMMVESGLRPHASSAPAASETPVEAAVSRNETEPPRPTLEVALEDPSPSMIGGSPSGAGETHFQTESAAELYFKQGLYREALAIYKNLFEKTGRTDYFLKIKNILLLLRADSGQRVIDRLQKFLRLLQQRGNQIV